MTPLVEAKVDNKELLFQFDTGKSNAELSAKYVRAFPQQFASLKGTKAGIGGAGGVRPLAAYSLPNDGLVSCARKTRLQGYVQATSECSVAALSVAATVLPPD